MRQKINANFAEGGGVPTGCILLWATDTAPDGWQICDGSAAATPALAAIVGANVPDLRTRVPVGKNSTGTFNTLKATGGAETVTLSETQIPSHTHTQNSHNHTQDSHNHTQNSHNHTQDAHTHVQNAHTHTQDAHAHSVRYKGFNITPASPGYFVLRRQDAADAYDGTDTDAAIAATAVNQNATAVNQNTTATNQSATATNQSTTATNQAATATNQTTGGGQSHSNLQPYIVLNYIIKT